jgi:hypothetical protein
MSLIPHAHKIFRTTSKSENHMQNSDGMHKNLKMHAVSMTPHAKYETACTIDERFERPSQPLKGISIKNILRIFPNCPTPPLKNTVYKFLKGLPNNKFSCMRCHWHRMTVFAFENRSYLGEFEAEFKKALFSPWVRGPGGIIWWKNRGSKMSWHCLFKAGGLYYHLYYIIICHQEQETVQYDASEYKVIIYFVYFWTIFFLHIF